MSLPSLRRLLVGSPKDPKDPEAFHKLSLIALLAWVGLGADGLSSSAYGPDEAFRALGAHTGLAFFLALSTAATVFIISFGYSRIIEQFPSGGGGYVVASRLLGAKVGVVSGAALLVDYVLTITISMASGADAIFSFVPVQYHALKLPLIAVGLVVLTILNVRGVKESVSSLVPVFMIFLLTHAVLLVVAIGGNLFQVGAVTASVRENLSHTTTSLGVVGALGLFVRAYSIGGGTYTGIEAVSNGVGMMREPRVQTAQRTMLLMAGSLALTAGGLLLAYLLVGVAPAEGKTMNAVLLEAVAGSWRIGGLNVGAAFVITALVSEGALLFVAAQAGFIDGPRVMANMAVDSWLPHRFAALSERLSMRNGVVLMSVAAAAALIYTEGDVSRLVVMYSINVFVTFALSNLAMSRFWWQHRREQPTWRKNLPVHLLALALCSTILVITIYEKFTEGGWVTLVATAGVVTLCFAIRRHYRAVGGAISHLDLVVPGQAALAPVAEPGQPADEDCFEDDTGLHAQVHHAHPPDPSRPVAVLFVGGYSGLGRLAVARLREMFPGHFGGIIFVSVAVVDSEAFKGQDRLAALEERARESLVQYERHAWSLGLPAESALAVGTEVAVEAESVALALARRYPRAVFVGGQIVFEEDTLWNRVLHNETALMIQNRLQRRGLPMIVLPVRIDLEARQVVTTAAERTAQALAG